MPQVHPEVLRSGDAAMLWVAEALVKALTTPNWLKNRLKPNGKMTQRTLTASRAYAAIPAVRNYLNNLMLKDYRTDSRQWYYFRYKYFFSDDLGDPSELDQRFTAVLQDPMAQIYQPGIRYIVFF
jgi:hypothetical protein